MTERDTHFQDTADFFFPEISKRFFTMYARILEQRPIQEIDAIEDEIRTLIAQFVYDVAYHALEYGCGFETIDWSTTERISEIPDLDTWPPTTVE